ncbi:HK97 family phage prohead protease [Demequina capsici]|uniref:HK97 family phage prohead protease n=1 Tax=Demequina capsici TaxID=3075620 RepID=A0AA96FB60_9MICO|nr:HK97 family phage prohead protease [Demequina sp. PMTSA13]WNM27546.1 HK97 family phage prohead protease [Demequina sp. PMTSA13]
MPAVKMAAVASVKAVEPTEDSNDPLGTFIAIVSVFGNEDYDGDIVVAGAFADSIKKWADSDRRLPVLWSHQFSDVDSILGYYSEASETDVGLKLKGHLDMNHQRSARVYELMKQGIIVEFSWSGEVLEYEVIEPEDPEDEWAWWWAGIKMLKIDLWEAGPCFKGANPETELLSIKAADLTGRLAERIRRQGKALTDDERRHIRALAEGVEKAQDEPVGDQPDGIEKDVDVDSVDETEDVRLVDAGMKARARLELSLTTEGR